MNFGQLRAQVRAYSKNTQATDAEIDQSIDTARQMIGTLKHPLLVEPMEALSLLQGGNVLPTRVASIRAFIGDGAAFDQLTPLQWAIVSTGGARMSKSKKPYFSVIGADIYLSRDVAEGLILAYRVPAPFVTPTDSNPMLETFPALWLNGALVDFFRYLQEDAPMMAAQAAYDAIAMSVDEQGRRAEWAQPISIVRG